MLEAIVLAAGLGSRFGGGKLLAPYKGGRLIDGALRAARGAPVERVTVVTGFDGDRVGDHARAVFKGGCPTVPLQIVQAADHAEGIAASLRAGVAALGSDADGAFVFLGDMPDIPLDLPHRLADVIGPRLAAGPVHRGVRGHPVLFSRRLFPQLVSLTGDRGARALLDDLGGDLAVIECEDPGVLFDVDLRRDLEH